MSASGCCFVMPRYKVQYRECAEGALLQSSFITAPNAEEAERAVRSEFTGVQANLGARQYLIMDAEDVVIATHIGAEEPQIPAGIYS